MGPGRPRLLTPEQEQSIKEDLGGPPSGNGFARGSWSAKMLARRIVDKFGVACSGRSAIRLRARLQLTLLAP